MKCLDITDIKDLINELYEKKIELKIYKNAHRLLISGLMLVIIIRCDSIINCN